MNREEFLTLLDELFELPPGTLTGEELLSELGIWDSTAALGFMALVDEHYGLTLSPKQFARCTTVADLVALVEEQKPA